ncbi:macrolide ABC transporter permease [Solibacillus sp. R5-41]|uniref:ABC transporter permease n=1 Tax=Solibacillus sp. R5-41 TaxID=2048654 RepID=UPI000C125234|nr:FtsX-like permease family protein [Solibacillus sp. R5-41]ATP38644.1 macrolide ABC transporter permease [Solibacillus sp. R5-41]
MLFKDQLQFVFQHMKKNKLRVTTTILATMIGCAFLIVLASIGFGIQSTMQNEILNREEITEIQLWGEEELTKEDEQWIQSLDHVNVILSKADLPGSVEGVFEERESISTGLLIDMEAQQKLPNTLSAGKLPKTGEEIVVGYHFAQNLLNEDDKQAIQEKSQEAAANDSWYDGSDEGYKGDLIGKEISLTLPIDENGTVAEQRTFKIVGIWKEPSYEWYQDTTIYFNEKVKTLYEELLVYPNSTIYVDSLEYVIPVLEQLKEKNYPVFSVVEQLEQMNMFFTVLKLGLIFVGTIAVLIASIGIFNTMTMAVTERTREIGVLKAIGASPNIIQRLFLMESAFIGLIGTVLAIALSYIISLTANALLPHILAFAMSQEDLSEMDIVFSAIPISLVLMAGSISLAVAILSGWRPARKATKIEVIQALRQEL